MTSDPEALAGVCVKAWPAVKPWQVALLCSTDESNLVAESCDSTLIDVYASYLTQLLADREDVGEEVGSDEEMVLASLEMLLQYGPALDLLADERGMPRSVASCYVNITTYFVPPPPSHLPPSLHPPCSAWSHKCSWPHSSLLASLVDMCATMTAPHLAQATSVCERYG